MHLFLEGVLDTEEDKDIINDLYNCHIKNENEFWTNYPFYSNAISEKNIENYKKPNFWGYYSQVLFALRCSLWVDEYNYSKDYEPKDGISSASVGILLVLFIYAVRRLNLIK